MSSGLKILQFYQSSSNSKESAWGIELANNLNDSFNQLEAVVPEFIYHDVATDSIEQTLTLINDIDFAIVSIKEFDLDQGKYLPQLEELLKVISPEQIRKIIVAPSNQLNLPSKLRRHNSYLFYDSFTHEPLRQKNYWHKLLDLTYDILRGEKAAIKGAVFLAESIDKFKGVRDEVRRELLRRGYEVLPKESFELEEEQPQKVINNLLAKSMLSVHIIGSGDSEHLTEDNISTGQNAIASDYCLTNPDLKRIVWVSEDSEDLIEDEYLYIEQLKRDKQLLHGAEVVQIPLEKLKNFVTARLQHYTKEENTSILVNDGGKKTVYLISDQEDIEKSEEVVKWLEEENLQVIQMNYSEEQMKIFQHHRSNLAKCDSVLIYHSRNNVKWLKMKLLDLLKAPGYGRVSPMLAKGLYLENKDVLKRLTNIDSNVLLLDTEGDMGHEEVASFCKKIEDHA